MGATISASLVDIIRSNCHVLDRGQNQYDSLIDAIGDARFVLLGEASHGTHEFYRERAQITKRLITEKGFNAVAVEADWPDAWKVNQYVQGRGGAATAIESLNAFKRFPTWMWRNADVLDFIGWLKAHNEPARVKTGFYGLDLYSLHSSLDAVIVYLQKVDPEEARKARARYACFENFGQDPQAYGFATSQEKNLGCEEDVIRQLVELQKKAAEYASRDGRQAADEFFFAEQNALLAKNAESYYRAMYHGRQSSWNLRDQHMAETLDRLVAHLDAHQGPARVVVWAHNSHLGDARATQMGERGELNLGQLVRTKYGDESFLVGFTTHRGTVTAASDWGAPAELKTVRPALRGSYEELLHDAGHERFMLIFKENPELRRSLREPRLERAIGVIYLPQSERWSHYFSAWLSDQFDAVLHFDVTRAVEPLDINPEWKNLDLPETYPSGF